MFGIENDAQPQMYSGAGSQLSSSLSACGLYVLAFFMFLDTMRVAPQWCTRQIRLNNTDSIFE